MTVGSTPAKNEAQSFLADGEEMEIQWRGTLIQGEDEEYPAEFVATDSRLVFSIGGGHFKDIGFQHVESVEVRTDIETETEGTPPGLLKGMGGISVVIGLGAMIVGGLSPISALVGISLIGLGVYGFWYANENYDNLIEDYEVTEHEVYHILLRTSATSPFTMPIYIETKENVGPDLSRLVTEAS